MEFLYKFNLAPIFLFLNEQFKTFNLFIQINLYTLIIFLKRQIKYYNFSNSRHNYQTYLKLVHSKFPVDSYILSKIVLKLTKANLGNNIT